MAISLVYFPAKLNLTSDDLMVAGWWVQMRWWWCCTQSREWRERGSRNKAAAAAAGSRLIGGRGRALLLHCCRVKLGFVKQRLEELCPLGMLPNSCWGRILRVKLAHKLRNK